MEQTVADTTTEHFEIVASTRGGAYEPWKGGYASSREALMSLLSDPDATGGPPKMFQILKKGGSA